MAFVVAADIWSAELGCSCSGFGGGGFGVAAVFLRSGAFGLPCRSGIFDVV